MPNLFLLLFRLVLPWRQRQTLVVTTLTDLLQRDLRFGNTVFLSLLLLPPYRDRNLAILYDCNPTMLLGFYLYVTPLQHSEDALLVGQALAQLVRDRLEEAFRVVVHLCSFPLVLQIFVSRDLEVISFGGSLSSFRN